VAADIEAWEAVLDGQGCAQCGHGVLGCHEVTVEGALVIIACHHCPCARAMEIAALDRYFTAASSPEFGVSIIDPDSAFGWMTALIEQGRTVVDTPGL
jgi:hypothetical protein